MMIKIISECKRQIQHGVTEFTENKLINDLIAHYSVMMNINPSFFFSVSSVSPC
jgi:hypothetical protein